MSYTTLRVDEAGVVLYDYHAARLGGDLATFEIFARGAKPGVYSIWTDGGRFRSTHLPGSRLRDEMSVRFDVSPFADRSGSFPKPAPPSAYDSVRQPNVVTLLTSADGRELYEACVAAVVSWDGARFLCVPPDRPRVASVMEAAVRDRLATASAPLWRSETRPLIIMNAVKGPCRLNIPGRARMPDPPLSALQHLMRELTRRP